jgi:hypothetical protein
MIMIIYIIHIIYKDNLFNDDDDDDDNNNTEKDADDKYM